MREIPAGAELAVDLIRPDPEKAADPLGPSEIPDREHPQLIAAKALIAPFADELLDQRSGPITPSLHEHPFSAGSQARSMLGVSVFKVHAFNGCQRSCC